MDKLAELEARIDAAKHIIAIGYERPGINPLRNGDQCAHGRFGWQDCIGCYDEALLDALGGPPNE